MKQYFKTTKSFNEYHKKHRLLCNTFFTILLALWSNTIIAQDLGTAWGNNIGGITIDIAAAVTTDAAGNVYVTGVFQDTVDFDPGPGVYTLISNGYYDMYVTKLDPLGNLIWAKSVGSSVHHDRGDAITLDNSGNVYITGVFNDTVDFDPGPGVYNLISTDNGNIFILKLDNAGNFQWAKSMGSTYGNGGAIEVDNMGNVYTTGYFGFTADFDPGPGVHTFVSAGSRDMYMSKLDSMGNFVWAKQFGSSSFDEGDDLILDGLGNIYLTGYFSNTVDFDPGPNTANFSSAGSDDVFIAKFNVAGDFIWVKTFGGPNVDDGRGIELDNKGHLYITGIFSNTVDFDPSTAIANLSVAGSADVFVSKFDTSGNYLWAKAMGGANLDFPSDIALDTFGNVYTTGHFGTSADFDPGINTFTLQSLGTQSAFISKLDSAGNFVLAKRMGNYGQGRAITVDEGANVYIVGTYQQTINLDGTILPSEGSLDGFVTKQMLGNTVSAGVCPSDSFSFNNVMHYQTGLYSYVIPIWQGLDSMVILNLYGYSNKSTYINQTLCQGQTYTVGDSIYTASGYYNNVLQTMNGCDSTVSLNLTINPTYNTVLNEVLCQGQTYTVGSSIYSVPGNYSDTLQTWASCDSIVDLNLIIHPVQNTTLNIAICQGESYLVGSYTYVFPGNYITTLQTWQGCDSIVNLTLSILPKAIINLVDTIYQDEVYTVANSIYTVTGNYSDTLQTWQNCDSIINLNLTVLPVIYIADTIVLGESYIDYYCFNSTPNWTSDTLANGVISNSSNNCITIYGDNYGIDTMTIFTNSKKVYFQIMVENGVWPGDTDDDALVSNSDLLNVGLAYGNIGIARDSQTIQWNGYLAENWDSLFINGLDYKYADADGNGIVDAADTLAIIQNWGLSYSKNGGNTGSPIYLAIDSLSIQNDSTVLIPIMVGTAQEPVTDLYGVAFSITYDNEIVQPNSIEAITNSNSWLGNQSNLIAIEKDFEQNEVLEYAITRINQSSITGYGKIGYLRFKLNENAFQGSDSSFAFETFNIIANDDVGIDIPMQGNVNYITLDTIMQIISSTENIKYEEYFKVYPNPVTSQLNIETDNEQISDVTVFSIDGKQLKKIQCKASSVIIDLNEIPNGFYFIRVTTDKWVYTSKVLKL